MSEKKIPVWIDTDTGVDDAVMLMCATSLPLLDIQGVSAVAGNAKEHMTFKNARNVMALCNRSDVPVYPGAEKPMFRDQITAEHIHGEDGLGGAEIPESQAKEETAYGYDAMYACAKKCGNELTVVAVGPLTNIALAIVEHPDFKDHVKQLVIMGGAVSGGNTTPSAEFNIYADPHAAEVVFKSGIPIIMFGLDVTLKSSLNREEIETICKGTNAKAKLYRDSTRKSIDFFASLMGERKHCIHDACPVLYLAYPEMFTLYDAGVYVETQSDITFGKTVCDLYSDFKFEDRHCKVAMDVNRDAFAKKIIELLLA